MQTILMKTKDDGRPYAEVVTGSGTSEDPTNVIEVTLDMLFCLFGVEQDLPIHRAGTCTRLTVHKFMERDGDTLTLTPSGQEVLAVAKAHLVNFIASTDGEQLYA